MRIRFVCASIIASALAPLTASAAPLLINFDTLSGMAFTAGNTIPTASQLSTQFLTSHGVKFSSTAPYVAVVNLGVGHAFSGANGIGGASSTNRLSYNVANPITISFFDPTNPTIQATTDFVSIRADLDFLPDPSATLTAFNFQGTQIGSVFKNDAAGQIWSFSQPGIHSVRFSGVTVPDGAAGGIALDDLMFNPVVKVPEPSLALLLVGGLLALRCQSRRKRE